jgi:hypothetical protein
MKESKVLVGIQTHSGEEKVVEVRYLNHSAA